MENLEAQSFVSYLGTLGFASFTGCKYALHRIVLSRHGSAHPSVERLRLVVRSAVSCRSVPVWT
eukprot:2555305-Amphidinium_carterae.1